MSGGRLSNLTPEGLRPDQRALYDAIVEERLKLFSAKGLLNEDGSLMGPFNVFLRVPGIGHDMQSLGMSLRRKGVLEDRLREIAILVVSARYRAAFEWFAHAPVAARTGVGDDALEAIRCERDPAFDDPRDAASREFALALLDGGRLGDADFGRLRSVLGEDGLFEIAATVGYYTSLAMMLNAFQVPLPEGATDPFADR